MTQTVKTEHERLTDAIEQMVNEFSETCPLCPWRPTIEGAKAEVRKNIKHHLESAHILTLADSVRRQMEGDGSAEAQSTFDMSEFLGIEVTDENDWENYLPTRIPKSLRDKLPPGARHYWSAQRNIPMYLEMGYQFAQAEGADNLNNSSEDGRYKSNELTLMVIPARVVELEERRRVASLGEPLAGKKEDIDRRRTDRARQAFDLSIKKGATREQARRIATAIENGLELDTTRITQGRL